MAPTQVKDGTSVGEVRTPLSLEKLQPYLEKNVKGFKGPITVKQFGFGQSNPTYLLETPGAKYVLRRAPLGKLMSSTAHRVDREYEIINAVNGYNERLPASAADRRVPVPKVFCLCMDHDVAGAPFYVMEFLKGRIFTDVKMPELPSREERYAIWRAAVEALALLATVPLKDLNLPSSFAPDPYAKPYFPRQVKSMLKISATQSKAPVPGNPGGILGDIYGSDELLPYFQKGAQDVANADNLHGCSIVHGDYKLDNMIFHPTEARVIGILDWELCTVGSPLADLGNMLIPWAFPPLTPEVRAKVPNVMDGLNGVPSSKSGIPQREELEAWWVAGMNRGYVRYASLAGEGKNLLPSGKPPAPWSHPIAGFEWVRGWMCFRLAIIMQGIAARAALGQASSAAATPKRDAMDFFGRQAYRCMQDDQKQAPARARL